MHSKKKSLYMCGSVDLKNWAEQVRRWGRTGEVH